MPVRGEDADGKSGAAALTWSVPVVFAVWAVFLEAIPFIIHRGSFHRTPSAGELAVLAGLMAPLIIRAAAHFIVKARSALRGRSRAA